MLLKYQNESGSLESEYLDISKEALDIYKELNLETFSKNLEISDIFSDSLKKIIEKHGQDVKIKENHRYSYKEVEKNNKVLLAFSGGLDSMYQALKLREQNFDVTLFHVKNMNYYTNGKETQVVQEFSKKFLYPIIYTSFKQNTKDNLYKKFWKENSFKNILLYCLMIDYAISNNIYNLSSGDDLRLNIKDSVVGTNVADAREVNLAFVEDLKQYTNLNFIFTNPCDKAQRIRYLMNYNALDMFYSCVNPGRFNQLNHHRIEQKFNIKLEHWNCGVCRKCAFHSLLRHYYLNEPYTKEFIDFCWEKICIGADYEFFKPSLSIEKRIRNLIDY